jgi:hypothetical protein
MGHLAEKYTRQQREAMAVAYVDRGIKPASRVVEAAARGELVLDGDTLAPFDTSEGTVRDVARKLRNRRAGKAKSAVAAMRGHDGPAALKRRLLAAADQELAVEENKRRGRRDIPRLQQIARMAREASAIPEPGDPVPVKPGEKIPGTKQTAGGKTTGGLAGAILAAAGQTRPRSNARDVPAPDVQTRNTTHGEETSVRTPALEQQHASSSEQQGGPGSWASEQVGALSPGA